MNCPAIYLAGPRCLSAPSANVISTVRVLPGQPALQRHGLHPTLHPSAQDTGLSKPPQGASNPRTGAGLLYFTRVRKKEIWP